MRDVHPFSETWQESMLLSLFFMIASRDDFFR